jgi:hypothetical protein
MGDCVRILIVPALLTLTASCAWPPPSEVAGPPPIAAAPAPAPSGPLAWPFIPFVHPTPPGRLTLSNFSYDHAQVEALITPFPDCVAREGTTNSAFMLALNGTRVIEAAPGADVCWRRALEPGTRAGAEPTTPGWTEWNRVFLSSAGRVDSRL